MEKRSLEAKAKRASKAVRPWSYLTRVLNLVSRFDSTPLRSISTVFLHLVLRQRASDACSHSLSDVVRVFVAYQTINPEQFLAHQRSRHRARPQDLKETAPELIFRGGPQHSTGASFSLPSAIIFIGLQVLPPGRCIYPFRWLRIGPSYLPSNVVEPNTTDDQESKPKPQRLPLEGPRTF